MFCVCFHVSRVRKQIVGVGAVLIIKFAITTVFHISNNMDWGRVFTSRTSYQSLPQPGRNAEP